MLYLIWRKPWYTVARSTYVSAMLALARWQTVPAISAPRYPTLADDAPAWREAERILLSTEPYAFRQKDASALAATLASRGRQVPVTLGRRRDDLLVRRSRHRRTAITSRRCAGAWQEVEKKAA